MKEIGEILRTARQSRNLTLDDIEEKTKIRKYYLQAIEDGNLSVIPGLVYARGFIRNYAEQVGVDGQAIMQEHGLLQPSAGSGSQPGPGQEDKLQTPKPDVKKQSERRSTINTARDSTLLPQVVMGIAIIGLLGLGLWFLNNLSQDAEPPAPPASQQSDRPSPQPAPSPQPNAPVAQEPSAELLKAETKMTGKSVYKAAGEKLKVEISTPNGDCWVQITIDGKVKESKTLTKGTSVSYEGNSEIAISAGLSTSLAVKVNNRQAEIEQVTAPYNYVFQKK